jgi:peptidoglycan L-alanyl-D-glutamate endopeptidase CwlK
MITLGNRSLAHMQGVHPDLVRVIQRAAALATTAQDFTVIEGVRSREQMCVNYGKGRSAAQCEAKGVPGNYAQPTLAKVTWLNDPFKSNHGQKADGYGHACDIMPYPIDWNDTKRIMALVALMKRAAAAEKVAIICGADWDTSPDLDHFELAA